MPLQNATVLLARLTGLSGLATDTPDKEFNTLLKEYYELVNATIRLHNGILCDLLGDTFMAVFLVEHSAIQAIEAITECRERLDIFRLERKLSDRIMLKAGIVYDTAVVEEVSIKEESRTSVMGEAVDFAGRLIDIAEDDKVLVNSGVYEVAMTQWDFNKMEPLPLRGSKEMLVFFELKDKKRSRFKPEVIGERKIFSEMVGRDNEAKIIETKINNLISGEGSVLNIVGNAGIGKSRLIAEIIAQPVIEKVIILEGRAQSAGSNLSFHPIIHIIKSWAGINEDDPSILSSSKLFKSIERVAREQAEEIYPFIATMMGLPLSGKYRERIESIEGEALEKLILKYLIDLIIIFSQIRPLVIILEDLHWIDQSSISFLKSLYRLTSNHKLLFINVFRPGYADTGDHIMNYLEEILPDHLQTIKLQSLPEDESATLISNLLHKEMLPEDIRQMIINKTEGNPFFIEEVIRCFLDDGIIEVSGNDFHVTDKINEANIPETISEVILTRVDKLDEKTKDLLKTASVIGRNFYYKVLEEAADTIGELDDRLEYLKDVQLIGESKKKEEIEFLFKHALAQQATYESIVLNTKKELHLKIARSIEKVFAENLHEFYGTLAYHYEKGENSEKTEEYLIKAGDEAIESGAFSEALSFFDQCLKLYTENQSLSEDDDKIFNIKERMTIAYHAQGEHLAALNFYEKILAFYGFHIPKNKIILGVRIIYCLLFLQFILRFPSFAFRKKVDKKKEKIASYLSLNAMALTTTNPKRIFIDTILATPMLFSSDYSKTRMGAGFLCHYAALFSYTGLSMNTGEKVLQLAEKIVNKDNGFAWVRFKFTKKHHDHSLGRWDIWPETDEIIRVGLSLGMFYEITIFHLFSGYNQIEIGSRDGVLNDLNGLSEIADNYENIHARAQYYQLQGHYAGKFRDYKRGIVITDEGLKYTLKEGHLMLAFNIYCYRSILHSVKNELNEAEYHFLEAEKLFIKRKLVKIHACSYLLAKSHLLMAKIISKRSKKINIKAEIQELNSSINKLLKNAKAVVSFKTEAYRLRAMLFLFHERYNKAFRFLEKSVQVGEKYGARLELSRTYFEIGKLLSNPKSKYNELNGHPASYYFEEAMKMFKEMDLQWDIEEYQKYINKL